MIKHIGIRSAGHRDGVYSMLTHPKYLPTVISGACDGELKTWNVTTKKCLSSVNAHTGFVRGMATDKVCPKQCISLTSSWADG